MMKDKYTTEELRFFETKTDELIIWLFDTTTKRYAINKILKDVYDKGKSKRG